ncbi:MAG: efflux transporter outer membrane subunit [Pseudomonadales bacterium]
MNLRSRTIRLFVLLLTLPACTMVGPDFNAPHAPVADQWSIDDDRLSATSVDHGEWWATFNDPTLTTLINEARAHNLRLQLAGLRVFEARAVLGRVRGYQYPQLQQLSAGVTAIELSENAEPVSVLPDPVREGFDTSFENYGIGIDAAWELDFWGKFRRGVEAADANLAGAERDFDDVLITLAGEVGSAYVLLRTLEERLNFAERNVAVQARSLEIAEVRFKNGLTTELDIQQSRALLRSTEATIPVMQSAIEQTKHAMSVLLGRPPERLDSLLGARGTVPLGPAQLDIGVPADLLRRRPDVRRAEMLAASQSALIGVARADMFPAFSLAGSIGYVADSTSDLFDSDSVSVIGGFGAMWNFLNYGRLRNNVRIEDARFQQLVTAYQLTVLGAAREVESALSRFLSAQQEVVFKADAASASERAVELALTQYRDGLTSYTTVLDTQRFQLFEQDQLTQARGKVALSLIAAYKALGGGWRLKGDDMLVPEDVRTEMQQRTHWGKLLGSE